MTIPVDLLDVDKILSLDRVRDLLGEAGKDVPEELLSRVREEAAKVLAKISDAELRERSAQTIVANQLRRLPQLDEVSSIETAYKRAKQLFLQAGGKEAAFYREYDLGRPKFLIHLRETFHDLPVDQIFDQIASHIETIIKRFGPEPVGKQAYAMQEFLIIHARIGSVTKAGYVTLKKCGGVYHPHNVYASIDEPKKQAIAVAWTRTCSSGQKEESQYRHKYKRVDEIPREVVEALCGRAHTKFLELNGQHFPEMNVPYNELSPEDKGIFERHVHVFFHGVMKLREE